MLPASQCFWIYLTRFFCSHTFSALLPTLEALANASFLGICSIGLMAGSVGYRGMASYDEGGGFARHGLDGGPVRTAFRHAVNSAAGAGAEAGAAAAPPPPPPPLLQLLVAVPM